MSETTQFPPSSIAPFEWLEAEDGTASVCLEAGEYKAEIFQSREEEGFLGNGYDWGSLIQVFLQERHSEWQEYIEMDPESASISVYCNAKENAREMLYEFIRAFVAACEDDAVIRDLFSRAELD